MQYELFLLIQEDKGQSTTVNIRHIVSIEPGFEGKAKIALSLSTGSPIVHSNLQYEEFLKQFRKYTGVSVLTI